LFLWLLFFFAGDGDDGKETARNGNSKQSLACRQATQGGGGGQEEGQKK
jgi:hypothetical protein